jgi:hypothetical protein
MNISKQDILNIFKSRSLCSLNIMVLRSYSLNKNKSMNIQNILCHGHTGCMSYFSLICETFLFNNTQNSDSVKLAVT